MQHAQSSSYDDTATTSSEFEQRVEVSSTGKRSRTSSSSSAKSVASSHSSKASKHSVASSQGSSKSNLDDECAPEATPAAVTAEEVAEQELLDEMIVKDNISDNLITDTGAVPTTHDIITEEEEFEADAKIDDVAQKQGPGNEQWRGRKHSH